MAFDADIKATNDALLIEYGKKSILSMITPFKDKAFCGINM